MTTGEILRRAAEVIEKRGWCQRELSDAAGRVCRRRHKRGAR